MNFETRTIKLWMDNDEGSYRHWQDVTQLCAGHMHEVQKLADYLEGAYDEELDDFVSEHSGPLADILSAAMRSVDWREIAQSMLADFHEENDEPEAIVAGVEAQGGN